MSAKASGIFKPPSAEEVKRRERERAKMNQKEKLMNQKKEAELEEFLNSLPVAGKDELDFALSRPVLYYPGAGKDFVPFRRFAEDSSVKTVVYCDYSKVDVCEVMKNCIQNISDEYEAGGIKRVEPDALGKNSWDEFWPEDPASRENRNPDDACGFFAEILLKTQNRKISFMYLATEGIQTYKILFSEKKVNPKVLVIPDPGMSAWDSFQGTESKLYEIAKPAPPEIIYTDEQRAWPGYERVSEFGDYEGANNSARAIYKMGGNRKNDTRI